MTKDEDGARGESQERDSRHRRHRHHIRDNVLGRDFILHLRELAERGLFHEPTRRGQQGSGEADENLTVATLLEPDGDVGFFANDTSSITVNMTAVLVLSSTGALLKCDGVGFPAGSGCSNSTPTLWETIDAGKGSSTIDTGYVYSPGTTDTLKVLTARGNTYTQTYPEPASTPGLPTVAVNLDNLKWVQLIPEASSLVQKNYVSNCNSPNCAWLTALRSRRGTSWSTRWAGRTRPRHPACRRTRAATSTTGTSSSVTVSASAALVQDKYTSNCNAALRPGLHLLCHRWSHAGLCGGVGQ